MTRINCLLIVLLIVYTQQCIAQTPLEKYLIIDTVVIEKHFGKKAKMHFLLSAIKDKYDNNNYECIDLLNNSYPNVSTKITYFDVDSMQLGILIDDKGSKIWLNHIENLPDTLHIKKWILFHNTLQDTTESSKVYSRYIDDSVVKIYNEKTKTRITNKHTVNEQQSISFILNDSRYVVPLKITNQTGFTTGRGYPSKRDEKKNCLYLNEERKHVKYRRFCITYIEKRKTYSGQISFN